MSDRDYECPGLDVDKVMNVLGEVVSKFNLQDGNMTEDILKRITPNVESVSTGFGKLSVEATSDKGTLFDKHEENSMKFPPVLHELNVLRRQQMPYIDINSQGFTCTRGICWSG